MRVCAPLLLPKLCVCGHTLLEPSRHHKPNTTVQNILALFLITCAAANNNSQCSVYMKVFLLFVRHRSVRMGWLLKWSPEGLCFVCVRECEPSLLEKKMKPHLCLIRGMFMLRTPLFTDVPELGTRWRSELMSRLKSLSTFRLIGL